MIYLELFYTFFKIGVFCFGGGYAMLSLIQDEVVRNNGWMTMESFSDIVAVSQMTPGPVAINTATYVGYTASGGNVLGSFMATIALIIPSVVMMSVVIRVYRKYSQNKTFQAIFSGIRPVVAGLIAAAVLNMATPENFVDFRSYLLFSASFLAAYFYRAHPILLLALGGLAGYLMY
ncbi:MAG TPA: chromate transporter [Bacteroidales bacterium]|jgi:chromate transporter|nr:chromate transporter [Bacteroidales bacterium]OQC58749.1 MAG: putative chromate transport protein [Bacteroidetes bacterium ADurb.Bin013]MBP8999053.1 chromate transporter [Bacteroidales bacterium]MBV6455809.1 putative chromate transport protein [Bacteroidales bacterium]NLZ08199.1 chromate transporter [Bacteroidales bacterium]